MHRFPDQITVICMRLVRIIIDCRGHHAGILPLGKNAVQCKAFTCLLSAERVIEGLPVCDHVQHLAQHGGLVEHARKPPIQLIAHKPAQRTRLKEHAHHCWDIQCMGQQQWLLRQATGVSSPKEIEDNAESWAAQRNGKGAQSAQYPRIACTK